MPPAVALSNYTSSCILWQIFCQAGIFAGFTLNIIYIVGRISAASKAGDIILFSLGGPMGDYTGAPTVIFREIFSVCYITQRNSESAMGGTGLGGRGGAGGTLLF